ncbi:MAG: dihydroorotase [Acetobacteraceae bacterium]
MLRIVPAPKNTPDDIRRIREASMAKPHDLVITNAKVVGPDSDAVVSADIAIDGGVFTEIGAGIDASAAKTVFDAGGRLAYPGVVDSHQHWGIYNPLREDAHSESQAAAQGGVTTGITYMRTGRYYLNQSGPYRQFMPKVLEAVEGRAFVDYGFHLAPMMQSHIEEIPDLITLFGVTSFKIFMFYGGFGLHGASDDQRAFLMIPDDEYYDFAHFEFVMRGVEAARRRMPDIAGAISLSLHCETAEIMRAYQKIVQREGRLKGLEAYSASRPPHSEGLAVAIASYLAHATALPTINLLHLSSAMAMDAAMRMATAFPHIDFRREVTIGHLLADFTTAAAGVGGKVNPPLRSRADVEALWGHVLAGNVDWVVSDHACCHAEMKFGVPRDDVFVARSGFGGTEYLLAGMITEGTRRGLSHRKIAQLLCQRPAERFGLCSKGNIALGYDGDLALVDDDAHWIVRAADSASTQEYTPFEGFKMTARVTDTFLRGRHIMHRGQVLGAPGGQYLRRPVSRR